MISFTEGLSPYINYSPDGDSGSHDTKQATDLSRIVDFEMILNGTVRLVLYPKKLENSPRAVTAKVDYFGDRSEPMNPSALSLDPRTMRTLVNATETCYRFNTYC